MTVHPGLHEIAAARLRRDGQRYTAGRRALVDTLAASPHPLPIADILAGSDELAQSSVYRNLAVLERAAVVAKVITNGEWACFELAEDLTSHHHHLICSDCGTVRDVEVPASVEAALDEALVGLAAADGFVLDRHRLDLVGRCSNCVPDHGAATPPGA